MKLFHKSTIILTAGLLCLSGNAETPVITPKGSLKIEDLTLSIRCFKPKSWVSSSQESPYFLVKKTKKQNNEYFLEGLFQIPQLPKAAVLETFEQNTQHLWKYRAEVHFEKTAELAEIGLCTAMPVETYCGRELLVDGKKIILPLEYNKKSGHALRTGKASELCIPATDAKITFRGNFELVLQDGRAFGGNNYGMRFLFDPPRGKINSSSLELSISVEPYRSTPLDLSSAATTGFADEKNGDCKGGWTDQGAENDLRMIPTGKQRWYGTDFRIIDPAENNGKSCIVLAGSKGFPMEASAPQTGTVQGHWFYLLHALAWPVNGKQVGKITISYTDGTSTVLPVIGGVDAGNWWSPTARRNGDIVWTSENKSAYIGLYRSVWKIENKPIRLVSFRSSGISVWGIAAASVSHDRMPKTQSAPEYIIAGKNWQPIVYHKDFKPGSILDFSSRLDAPAGKYGPVVIRNGKFVFRNRPDRPVRFYGANLCGFSQYLDKAWAERLADRFAAIGYNAVRFHHHDNRLGLRRNPGDKSSTLDPYYTDQLDYLISCFRKRGIYYTTDLYVSRRINKGEIPEFPDARLSVKAYKALAFVLPSVMDNWKTFAKNWLTHVNPYTGLALKDDPALISLSLINEDNLSSCWNATPETTRIYLQKFEEWKKKTKTEGSYSQQLAAFLVETYNRGFMEMKEFIRGLGVKTPLSDQNMNIDQLLSTMRAQYDFVDNHFYWDHPSFPENSWQLPSTASGLSAISQELRMPGRIFPTRLLDRPMTITEFDYAKPNFFRAEGAVLTGAYAALQDWDALFQFAYSHSREKVIRSDITESHFDSATDVVKSLSQRIGLRLFLDRELQAAPSAFAAVFTNGKGMDFSRNYSKEFIRLGLIARIGALILPDGAEIPADIDGLIDTGINFPARHGTLPVFRADGSDSALLPRMRDSGLLKTEWFDLENKIFRAPTGQLTLDCSNGTFKAVTASCEALILPAGKKGKGNFIEIENHIGHAVFSVMSADGKPLAESGRLLLIHLTDSQASKTKFSRKMTRLESWGTMPFLAARGEAEITLHAPSGTKYTLYSVDTAGNRLAELPARRTDAGIRFPVNVFTEKGSVFLYELVRK